MTHLSSLWLLIHVSFGLLNSHVAWSLDDPFLRTWSEWTPWSACSRSCGGGAKMRTRVCKMSGRGYSWGAVSKSCSGENVEYELCSVQNCPPGAKEFLEYQCSLRDGQRGVEWIPYTYGPNPCELQCWSMDRTLVHSFGKATDGTKCATPDEPGQPALCINGRCTSVDCAGQIGRDNKLDRCGVCRGNNATCVHRRYALEGRPRDRTSDGQRHYEYDRIATIPSGATEISVREDSDTNFLALSDERGDYQVNGNWRIQSPGRVLVQGTEFSYDRSWNGAEYLRAHGPTRFDTHVYVLGTGDVPPVQIEFWISADNPRKQTSPLFRVSNQIKDSLEIYPIGNVPLSTPIVRFQGYRSYYHRNEILKSVPSWSAKRHGARKSPTIRRIDIQSDVVSTTVTNRDVFRTTHHGDRGYVHRTDPRTLWAYGVRRNASVETIRQDGGRFVANAIPSTKIGRKSGIHQKEVFSVTARPNAISESSNASVGGKHLKKKDKYLTDKKRNLSKKKRKSGNEECQSCPKPKQQKKSFCSSDFVLRVVMLSVQKLENSFRYELRVVQSYKNKVPISPREYVWTTATPCRCPRLRTDREYILMGRSGTSGNGRESRLLLDADSFARKYAPKRARTLQRMVRDHKRICKKYE